mmetsp:Transcript_11986/g.20242  ORF Transcript_11986/g.20242 Transcript_11986/m.20242 type:complete len:87 (+) Transcript_11986:1605-1865(+)
MDKAFGQDGSDSTLRFRAVARMRMPDPALKELLWREISDLQNNVDFHSFREMCACFTLQYQYALIEPFLDQFFGIFERMLSDPSYS